MMRHLAREGVTVGGMLGPIYRKPRTTVANPEHRVYPYAADRAAESRAADITYIPVIPELGGLNGVLLGSSLRPWRSGTPEIFNTDQGSQFTSVHGSAGGRRHPVLDGRPRSVSTTRSSRLWRSLKATGELADGFAAQLPYNEVRPPPNGTCRHHPGARQDHG